MIEFIGRVSNGVVVPNAPIPLKEGARVRIIEDQSQELIENDRTFWEDVTLEQLFAMQGTPVIRSIDDIPQIWPSEDLDDGFEEAVRAWRHGTEPGNSYSQ